MLTSNHTLYIGKRTLPGKNLRPVSLWTRIIMYERFITNLNEFSLGFKS